MHVILIWILTEYYYTLKPTATNSCGEIKVAILCIA